jgi:hypothetical protein
MESLRRVREDGPRGEKRKSIEGDRPMGTNTTKEAGSVPSTRPAPVTSPIRPPPSNSVRRSPVDESAKLDSILLKKKVRHRLGGRVGA